MLVALRGGYSVMDLLFHRIGLPVYSNGYYGFKYTSIFTIPLIIFICMSYQFHKKLDVKNTGEKFIILFLILTVGFGPRSLNLLQDHFYRLNSGVHAMEYIKDESKLSIENDHGKRIIHYDIKLKNHSNKKVAFIIEAEPNDGYRMIEGADFDHTYCKSQLLKLNKKDTYLFEMEKIVDVEEDDFAGIFPRPKISLSNETQKKTFFTR